MASSLVFPDGIRLASRDELPGPNADREALWERMGHATIAPGYTLVTSTAGGFSWYAEANVDAPRVWEVFCDLCAVLLGP